MWFLIVCVSIPLWFDSNSLHDRDELQRIVVSIPLWFDSNPASRKRPVPWTLVSIPLWFDSNQQALARSHDEAVFQFHSGSIQTFDPFAGSGTTLGFNSTLVRFKPRGFRGKRARICAFQFHSGSIQTQEHFDSHGFRAVFQFHSGSIQTIFVTLVVPHAAHVSIPLWFDSN